MAQNPLDSFDGISLEEVARRIADADPNSHTAHHGRTEFLLRQSQWQHAAAEATERTAKSTAEYTKYMFWSVVILAGSALASFIIELIRLLKGL